MEVKLKLQQDQVGNFSYSFAKALLDGLKKLVSEGKVSKVDGTNQSHVVKTTSYYLKLQLGVDEEKAKLQFDSDGFYDVATLIENAEEFLSLFLEN